MSCNYVCLHISGILPELLKIPRKDFGPNTLVMGYPQNTNYMAAHVDENTLKSCVGGPCITNCGSHRSTSCEKCPFDFSIEPPKNRGAHWCHGDCNWINGICKSCNGSCIVNCGQHRAASCEKCPFDFRNKSPINNGAGWCHGDCSWVNGSCIGCDGGPCNFNCGNHRASSCEKCPLNFTTKPPENNGAGWCHGDCSWVNGICKGCVGGPCKFNCGNHWASSCTKCPIDYSRNPPKNNGAGWCHGDCRWESGNCKIHAANVSK